MSQEEGKNCPARDLDEEIAGAVGGMSLTDNDGAAAPSDVQAEDPWLLATENIAEAHQILEGAGIDWMQVAQMPVPQELRRPVEAEAAQEKAPSDPKTRPVQRTLMKWCFVQPKLERARRYLKKTREIEEEAFAALDCYLDDHGEEGRKTAGHYVRMLEDYREELRAIDALRARRRERRAAAEAAERELREAAERAEREKKAAEEEARRAEERAAREVEKARRRAENAASRALFAAREIERAQLRQQRGHYFPTRSCEVCGMRDVARGNECPNRDLHYLVLRNKKK